MTKTKRTTILIARTGVEAALYFVLTFFMQPIAFSPVLQFRIGEALTLLPLIFPEAVVGVTIGCLLANVLSPYMWYDMVFGTLATFIAALLTYLVGKKLTNIHLIWRSLIGAIPPVLVNAAVLPLMWMLAAGDAAYWYNFAMLLITQSGAVIVIGVPLTLALDKAGVVLKRAYAHHDRKK